MRTETFEVTRMIAAPASVVYNFLADYRNGHSRILPRKYFSDVVVEEGGIGEGTRIRYALKAYGARRVFQAVVEEQEPGRRLLEIDLVSGAYKTFTVEDRGIAGCEVTIRTRVPAANGFAAAIDSFLIKRLLQNVFSEQLRLLSRAVRFPAITVSPVRYEDVRSAPVAAPHPWLAEEPNRQFAEAS
jgi:hypothetical protein